MAEERPIDKIKTVTVAAPPPPLAKVLEGFTGRHTVKTVAAAKRIAAKKRTIKVPGHLLRQLFRAVGGWGNSHPGGNLQGTLYVWDPGVRMILLGDLRVFGKGTTIVIGYRQWRNLMTMAWCNSTAILEAGEDVGGKSIWYPDREA